MNKIELLNIENVAKCILKYKKVNEFCIFLNMDELHYYISNDDINYFRITTKSKLIQKMAITIMNMCSKLSNFGIFVVSTFSGRSDPIILEIMPPEIYNVNNIFLSGFNDKSSIEIFKNSSKNKNNSKHKNIPDSLILAMGGIPHVLEILNEEIYSNKYCNYQELYEIIRGRVNNTNLLYFQFIFYVRLLMIIQVITKLVE